MTWLPPGIKDPGYIPPGEHFAEILDISGFKSKKTGDYLIRIFLKCSTGESGPITIRFFADNELRSWINGRNEKFVDFLLFVAHQETPRGVEPNWAAVLSGVKGLSFKITVEAKKNGAPYLTELDLDESDTDLDETDTDLDEPEED